PRLLSGDVRQRAVQRRMIREADQYVADAMERLGRAILFTPPEKWSGEKIADARADLKAGLGMWEGAGGGGYLGGTLTAVDFTLYPMLALVERMGTRKAGLVAPDLLGPKLTAWMQRMKALPVVQKTRPPHWK